MTAPTLMQLDPTLPLTDAANGGFVRAALAGLPRSARNAMFDAEGMLNSAGRRQLREAIFARAWPDADIIARYAEGDAGELKSLLDALETAAPAWAALRADIEAGLVKPEMDISGFVLDAMRLIGAARDVAAKDGLPISKAVAELLEDVDLYEGPVAPLTVAMVKKFWTNGRAAKAADVASFLTRYADDARKAGASGGLFDAPGPRDVLRQIDGPAFADLPENMGAPRVVDSAEVEPMRTVEDGFDEGAASVEAQAADAAIVEELRAADPVTQAADAPDTTPTARADLDALRGDYGDVPIDMPDGTSASVRELLDDLDSDAGFDAFIQGCAITPTGATP